MTPSLAASTDLTHPFVIALGAAAQAVAARVEAHHPIERALAPVNGEASGAKVLAWLAARDDQDPAGVSIPAVVVIAEVAEADRVADLLAQLRRAPLSFRPRIWPAFIGGDISALDKFDAAIDAIGPGACDVVLLLTGAPGPTEQADALAAWLHVKMPAPASVLGELPAADGQICRYVALGAQALSSESEGDSTPQDSQLPLEMSDEAITTVTEQLRARVTNAVKQHELVTKAREQVSALSAAATKADTAEVLSAEATLTEQLAAMGHKLPIAAMVETEAALEELPDPADFGRGADTVSDEAAPVEQASTDTTISRSEAVSALVMLTSKGGLSRMFTRSRIAGAAEVVATAASRDLDALVQGALANAAEDLDSEVRVVYATKQAKEATKRVEERQSRRDEQSAGRDQRLRSAVARVAVWPSIDATKVRRSWGGGVPAARRYVVASPALVPADETDDFLFIPDVRVPDGVIDLTDSAQVRRPSSESPSDALVLVAQYGLPLSAL